MQCNDAKCPFHGHLKVRGNIFSGTVKSAKAPKTVSVERTFVIYVPKYERYKKTKSRISAHNPDCIAAKEGDIVQVGETRKLSKTKSFVVLKIEKKSGTRQAAAEEKEIEHEKEIVAEETHEKKEHEGNVHEEGIKPQEQMRLRRQFRRKGSRNNSSNRAQVKEKNEAKGGNCRHG